MCRFIEQLSADRGGGRGRMPPRRSQAGGLMLEGARTAILAGATIVLSFAPRASAGAAPETIPFLTESAPLAPLARAFGFEAKGDVRAAIEGELTLSGDRGAATLKTEGGRTRLGALEVETFAGETVFTNSVDEKHTLYFRGASGEVTSARPGGWQRGSTTAAFDSARRVEPASERVVRGVAGLQRRAARHRAQRCPLAAHRARRLGVASRQHRGGHHALSPVRLPARARADQADERPSAVPLLPRRRDARAAGW